MSTGISCLFTEERPITVDEACAIRLLLFGETTDSFSVGWKRQGFQFRNFPPYLLNQKCSGPCGVVAAVQSYIIYELLFGYSRLVLDDELLRPDDAERKEALARAITNILWQASNKKRVILAKKSGTQVLNEAITSNILVEDGILEYVQLNCFQTFDHLLEYLYNFNQQITKDGGCILFLYSLILTHGVDKIKEEMDFPESNLIGSDGFCSQEVVNLILIGKAVPNVFDGNLKMDDTILKGIPHQSKIGFLSLSEYQNNYSVGTFYKDPACPIWVIFGEYHFSVLFGTSRNILRQNSNSFQLFYIDPYSSEKNEIALIIEPDANEEIPETDNKLSVILRCIYTRWPYAEVEIEEIEKKRK